MALLDLLADAAPHPVDPVRLLGQGYDAGLHGCAAGGKLGQGGDLEVAEDGHRDGARDRRRGHHQDVGRGAGLVGEGGPLLDAEAVLLVDDDEAEVGELHVLLEQGVGADHEAGLAARSVEHRLGPGGLRHRAGEQDHAGGVGVAAEHAAGREVAEHRGDRAEVLLREDLGRGQQCCLAAGVDDPQHRPQRDQGLAGADLALEQPVHRVGARQVGLDLGRDLLLATGQGERQPRVEGGQQPSPTAAGLTAEQGQLGSAPGEDELGHQRLVESEPPLGRGDLLPGVGLVDPLQRGAEVGQAVLLTQGLG